MLIKLTVLLMALLGGIYSILLNIVRYRSASNPTPENLADVYDAETYQKWKRYSAEHCRVSIIFDVITLALNLALLAANVYSAFASLFGDSVFWQLFAVILLESAISAFVGVFQSYISNMIIEEKYGFNKTSKKTFVIDRVRSFILGFLLSLGIVLLLWGLHSLVGDFLIVLFAAVLFVITLLISFLYPIFSRIGNKFTPLEDGELKDSLMALLTKHGYKVKAIEVMDASRRTTKLNAYFTGFGKMKTIVLFDNLVNAMSTEEICAVFAHELGHGLNKDVLKNQILNIANLLIMALVAWVAVREPGFYEAFGFDGVNYGFAYILISVGLGLIQPLTGIVMNLHSRTAEYRADKQAVKEGYGEAMIVALKKLAKENFAHLSPSKINVVMEYSHPPLGERIGQIEKQLNK